MNAIRIRRTLESDTLFLPELKPLIGRQVEIVVQEAQPADAAPGTGDWEAAEQAAQQLRETGYDFDAWREQREYDLRTAGDALP